MIVVEERLVFEFGEGWQVQKYDGHSDHENGLKRLASETLPCEACGEAVTCPRCGRKAGHGSKVVDILGRYGKSVYLIEVKDFRERGREENPHLREDQKRIVDRRLAVEVALKVRDTLASVIGALHQRDTATWQPMVEPILRHGPPKIVLWLEEDTGSQALYRTVQDQLASATRWLNPHAMVMSRRSGGLPAVTVGNLSDRVFALRRCMKGKKKDEKWITRDEFCQHMEAPPQTAGERLEKLERAGFLERTRAPVKRTPGEDRFAPGPRWDEFHEEPA